MPECFVVMGFGTKQDPDTGRMLNLNSTFEFIIRPAVEAAGYTCIRADEILHSGVIDRPMYEKLLNADLVVADITTANANAIYELGVRHALRPHSTIVIKEQDGKRYFDLNHLATISYKHLGEEIGAGEALRKAKELQSLIEEKSRQPRDDSPVYEFLRGLTQPTLASPAGRRGAPPAGPESTGPTRAELRGKAIAALRAEDFEAAKEHLGRLVDPDKIDDPWAIQELAFATYKSGKPNEKAALRKAQAIIRRLGPEESTDPQTLGIAGAIEKRLWKLSGDRKRLDSAIDFYGRAWTVHAYYCAGENYAGCLEVRADATDDNEQSALDRVTALRVRRRLVDDLAPLVAKSATKKRDDYKWMLATLSNTQLALGDAANAEKNETAFRSTEPADWEIETFEATKKDMAVQARTYKALRKKMGI